MGAFVTYSTHKWDQLKDFKVQPFWNLECGVEGGREALKGAEETLTIERAKLDTAVNLCTLFEFPDLLKESQQMIGEMESNCKLMHKVRASGGYRRLCICFSPGLRRTISASLSAYTIAALLLSWID